MLGRCLPFLSPQFLNLTERSGHIMDSADKLQQALTSQRTLIGHHEQLTRTLYECKQNLTGSPTTSHLCLLLLQFPRINARTQFWKVVSLILSHLGVSWTSVMVSSSSAVKFLNNPRAFSVDYQNPLCNWSVLWQSIGLGNLLQFSLEFVNLPGV